MENQENKDTNVKSTVDAVTGLVKAIPVYQDAIQPSAKQIGKSLETVTKTVNIALAPIKILVWGYEKIEEFISTRVSEKLKNVAEKDIISPPIEIAGPAVEALRFTGHEENLRELFANLLASSMDKNTTEFVHPGFVEILKNLSSDEAVLLQAFINTNYYALIDVKKQLNSGGSRAEYANFSHLHKAVNLKRPDLIPTYINNLCRLGIMEIPALEVLSDETVYESIENDISLEPIRQKILNSGDGIIIYNRKYVMLTTYGKNFRKYVVLEK